MLEEKLLARAHVAGCVLRPVSYKAGLNYRVSHGHVVAFKQDPSALLSILPSKELQLHEVMTVAWEGKTRPTDKNLASFCTIRKSVVLRALEWLCANNPVYRGVTTYRSRLFLGRPIRPPRAELYDHILSYPVLFFGHPSSCTFKNLQVIHPNP
jgi:hypothetical protein